MASQRHSQSPSQKEVQEQYDKLNDMITTLAVRVGEKEQELEQVKNEYDNKIKYLNDYLTILQKLNGKLITNHVVSTDDNEKSKLASHNTIVNDNKEKLDLSSIIECPSCRKPLWNVDELDKMDYIIIPKSQLTGLSTSSNDKNAETKEAANSDISVKSTITPTDDKCMVGNNSGLKSGKTTRRKKGKCSYCSQEGHKRAECPSKLYGRPIN